MDPALPTGRMLHISYICVSRSVLSFENIYITLPDEPLRVMILDITTDPTRLDKVLSGLVQ